MSERPIDLSVLIATRNRAALLESTLARVESQALTGVRWEVLVVDNGSADATPDVLARAASRLPLVTLFEPVSGKYRALNRALAVARGELLVFTDDDVQPAPGWLAELLAGSRRWPEARIFAGQILPDLPPDAPAWARRDGILKISFAQFAPPQGEGPLNLSPFGPNFAVRAPALVDVRFDERIGPRAGSYAMGGETELLQRLQRRGEAVVYLPSAVVTHVVRPEQLTLRWQFARSYRFGRGQARLAPDRRSVQLFGAPRYLWRMMGAAGVRHLLAMPLGAGVRVDTGRALYKLAGRIHECRLMAREKDLQPSDSRAGAASAPTRSRRVNRTRPMVTVAIPTFNRCDLLRQALEHVARLRIPAGVSWEVLVVNNRSTDATEEVVASFSGLLPIRCVREPALGVANSRNRMLREARGNYILCADDDVLVDENWLAAFVDTIQRHEEAAVVGGPIEPHFVVPPDPDLVAAFPSLGAGFCGLDYDRAEGPIHRAVNSANMGLRRSAVDDLEFSPKVGRVGSDGLVGGEEVVFIHQLLDRGETVIWSPEMKVRHVVSPSRTTLDYLRRYERAQGRTWVRLSGVPAGPRVLQIPRWIFRSCLASFAWYALRSLTGDRRRALAHLREYCFLRGALDECLALRWSPRQSPVGVLHIPEDRTTR